MDLGTGATITFGTSGAENTWGANITKFTPPGMEWESHDTSRISTVGGRTALMSKLFKAGDVEIEGFLNVDVVPALTSSMEEITITLTDPTSATTDASWVFQAALKSFQPGDVDNDGLMTFTATLEVSGDIVVTPGT